MVEIGDGDIFISDISSGIIMKSPDGNCWRGTLDNSGNLVFSIIDCPGETQDSVDFKSAIITNITIFPNPSENTVTIASLDRNFKNSKAILYTTDGKVVRITDLSNNYDIVNLGNIPAGSYIISLVNKRGKVFGHETIPLFPLRSIIICNTLNYSYCYLTCIFFKP